MSSIFVCLCLLFVMGYDVMVTSLCDNTQHIVMVNCHIRLAQVDVAHNRSSPQATQGLDATS